jgi:hypothetical protein
MARRISARLAQPMVSAGVMTAGEAARLAARPGDPDFLGCGVRVHRRLGQAHRTARMSGPVHPATPGHGSTGGATTRPAHAATRPAPRWHHQRIPLARDPQNALVS